MATKTDVQGGPLGGNASQQIKQFDSLRDILKNAKHSSGQDLYQHLVDVMNHIVTHCPDNGIDKFEEISYLLKQQREGKIQSISEFLRVTDERPYSKPGKEIQGEEAAKYFAKAKKLLDKKGGASEAAEGGEGGEDAAAEGGATAGPCGFVPDILADSRTYQWGGIGFGDNETLLLAKALKQLSVSTAAQNVRLWGKIQGTKRDYYIAEGQSDAGVTEEEKPPGFEARGTGVNKYVYWATNSPLEAWTQLPDLTPSDIQAAREIKVHFTGNLDNKIITNPFFFKIESFYLRAQIARISFSTTLVPKGLYRTLEDNEKEIEDNTPAEGAIVIPGTIAMSSAEMWVHHTQNILKNNRVAHQEQGDGDDAAEIMKKIEAADPYEKRLKSIALDRKVKGQLPSWNVRLCGDRDQYGTPKSVNDKVNYGVVVVRSLQWPGATTFFTQGRWLQIYVGDGLKYEQKSFYPIFPPVIKEDPVEKPCYPEPNPRGYIPGMEEKPKQAEAPAEEQ